MELVVQASIVLVSEICEAALGVRRARSHGRSCAAKVNMMLFVPFFPLYKPISFLPQGRHSPAGELDDYNHVSSKHTLPGVAHDFRVPNQDDY